MNAVVPFAFEDHLFRALDRGGEPWFIAGDVAKILGHRHTPNLVRLLDEDEKDTHTVGTPGGPQEVAVISEPGLYRAIIQRRASPKLAPEVRDLIGHFQRWVFHEVLPTLRRTGRYAMPGASPADPVEGRGPDSEYRLRLDTVAEARRIYGPARARLLYERLGLPEVPELPPEDVGAGEAPASRGTADAIAELRALLREKGTTAFVPLAEADELGAWDRRGLVGCRHPRGDYLIPLPSWRGFLAGHDELAVARELARAGWLVKDTAGRSSTVARICGRPMRVYRIRAAFAES